MSRLKGKRILLRTCGILLALVMVLSNFAGLSPAKATASSMLCEVTVFTEALEMGTVTGMGTYSVGSTVTLTAYPSEGYEFIGWVDQDLQEVYYDNPFTFVVTGDRNVGVVFRKKGEHFIYVISREEGEISVNPDKSSYAPGERVYLSTSVYPNYVFDTFLLREEGQDKFSEIGNYFTMPDNAVYVSARYRSTVPYNITIDPNVQHGTFTLLDGKTSYLEGETVRIGICPEKGYQCTEIGSVTAGYEISDNVLTFKMPRKDLMITGIFEKRTSFNLTLGIYPENGGTVEHHKSDTGFLTMTAKANEGYVFKGYYDFTNQEQGELICSDSYYEEQMTDDLEILALFEKEVTVLHFEYPTGTGTTSVKRDASTNQIVATATANEGYVFKYWGEYPSLKIISMEPTFSFEAGTYETIVAFFEVPVTSTLHEPLTSQHGKISIVDYKTTYLEGDEIEITVTPDPGYVLENAYYGVYEDHTLKKAHVIEGNKFRMPGYDTWLFATFVRGCEVTASASLSEGGTVTGGGTFQTGETVTLTATAKDGYEFVNWTENGEEVSTLATYQFTASEDRELVANFQRIELVYENYFYEDFGLSLREGWTVVDSDGDGHGWHPVYAKRDYPEEDFSTSGRFALMSDTVSDDGMLDPDDWAITPAIIVPKNGVMTFWLTTYSANPKSDKLVVYVGLSPEIDKMTKVNIFNIAAGGGKKCKVRLSTFEGQKVYIGFRHYNSAGGAAVVIDDVEVDGDGGVLTDENLAIAKKSLTLYDTISIDFKIPKSAFSYYHDPYLLVTRDTTNEKITDYREDGDFWIFNYRVAPQTICDVVTAAPHALNTDGEDVTGVAFRYSVAEYCYNMLNNAKYQTDEYAVFRRLLVDILLYGDAAQIYAERKTNELAGAKLTDAQRAMGTDVRVAMTYQTVKEPNFATVEDEVKLASIEKVALYLEAAVNIRFKYSADDLSGLRVVITDNEAGTNVIAQYPVNANLIDGNGLYYVDVDALNAGQMRKTVYATVMKGNQKVSNTYCYSIESYVESRKKNGVKALRDLLDAMMRYGDSAAAYVESMQ